MSSLFNDYELGMRMKWEIHPLDKYSLNTYVFPPKTYISWCRKAAEKKTSKIICFLRG